MDAYKKFEIYRRIQKYLALEYRAWLLAKGTAAGDRKSRLEALSLRCHVRADELQHRLIAAGA